MKLLLPILFACGTALCFGLYGPTIAKARSATGEWSPFKPYVFIGLAYVVWACAGGLIGMKLKGDSFGYDGAHLPAMIFGFLAGTCGALGAFSLTSAMLSGGKPMFGAVSITALVSVLQLKEMRSANPVLWVGMAMVVVGIVLVAANTPHPHPPKKGTEHTGESAAPPPSDAPSASASLEDPSRDPGGEAG